MRMAKIKLLMYSTIFSSGGAEKTVLDIVNNLDLNKYIIYLVIGRKNNSSYSKFLKNDENIKYINFGLGDDEDYKIADLLAEFINKNMPDICFAPGIFTNLILMDAIDRANYKPKVVLRESAHVTTRELPLEICEDLTNKYNKADIIIPISKGIRQDLVINFHIPLKKCVVINNPFEISKIENMANIEMEDKYFNNIKGRKIISLARFTDTKDHITLLKAFKKVCEKEDNINLVLLGSGLLEENVKHLARELKIDKKVHFLGFKDNPFYYLKKSDLFVLSSKLEGFPHTIVEAMILKVPVISTNCKTGPRDILGNNRYGHLVNVGDVDGLANVITKLLASEKKLNKKVDKAYRRAYKYEISKIIVKYDKIFTELLK